MADLTLFFNGAAAALLLQTAVTLARPGAGTATRFWGAAFALSVVGYVVWNAPALVAALGPLKGLAWLFSTISSGFFVLFARALLIDRTGPDRAGLAVLAAFTVLSVTGAIAPHAVSPRFWMTHQLLEFACYGYALWLAVSGWRDDLDEDRRRIRGPIVFVITVYGLLQGVFESWSFIAPRPGEYLFWEAVALAAVAFAVPLFILQTRWDRIGAAALAPQQTPAPAPPTDGLDAADTLELTRVLALVDDAHAYREEGLTIGTLAERVAIPEHRLRRLINRGLGFRNYAAFLNARRIGEAMTKLADPAAARTPILTLALDLGYGSVGPFNRAFKDATGMTPTEWRRQNLAPKPE